MVSTDATSSAKFDGVKLVYILYFVGFVVGVTTIAGLIVAYLKRGEAAPEAATHFTFQIRTFWIGLLFYVISVITMFILIGWILALATFVWMLIRLIKGFMAAGKGEPIPNPQTWMW